MLLKTYVLNLDRHPERLANVADQLDAQGVDWARFQGLDAKETGTAGLDPFVARSGPIPRMPDGARACTAGHYAILKDFLQSDETLALVLEDDIVISSNFSQTLSTLIHGYGQGIVNISRFPPHGRQKKLVVRPSPTTKNQHFAVLELMGIHYGTAGYLIDRETAKLVLEMFPFPDMPIDHIYFNPNVSRLGKAVPVRQLFPAIVKPREDLVSSIQTVKVKGASSLPNKLKRLKAEVSIAPRLLLGVLFGRYKVKVLDFDD